MGKNKSYLTALNRTGPSGPLKYLLENKIITNAGRILDYGCGKGADVVTLYNLGADVMGYDSYYQSFPPGEGFDIILCTFVLNVLPRKSERDAVLQSINDKLTDDGAAYISVRNDRKHLNGWTKRGTWQGYIVLDLPVVHRTGSYVMYKMVKQIHEPIDDITVIDSL